MKTKTSAFTLIELLIVLAILGLMGAIVFGAVGGCSKSDGNRVGTITKFSHKGVWHKTYEGELVMGGARNALNSDGNSSVVANIWTFSVIDPKVVEKIQALQDSGHRAKLAYHQTLMHAPWSRDTSYIVIDATDLDVSVSTYQQYTNAAYQNKLEGK